MGLFIVVIVLAGIVLVALFSALRPKASGVPGPSATQMPPPPPSMQIVQSRDPQLSDKEKADAFWLRRRECLTEMLYASKRSKESEPLEEHATFSLGYTNEDFDAEFKRIFQPVHFFPVVLAGVSFPNDDGSRRDVVVALCRELDQLLLEHIDSEYSKTAVAVKCLDGLQLGYLPDHIGAEVISKFKSGRRFGAVFREPHYHPDRKVVVGAAIYIYEPCVGGLPGVRGATFSG